VANQVGAGARNAVSFEGQAVSLDDLGRFVLRVARSNCEDADGVIVGLP